MDIDTPHHGGGIYNYFGGAHINNLVINGNMTKSGPENYGDSQEKTVKKDVTNEKPAQANENFQVINGPIVDAGKPESSDYLEERMEELFHFVHPELGDEEAWRIHDAVKRVVKVQGIQMICQYLTQLKNDKKILLPPNPSVVYSELVRIGMPNGDGFNEITFRKYYNKD